MELVLESTSGVPEDGLLSIKVGNTKRQAPAAKLGQPFRFSTSLADPAPLKVELLAPAAPAQLVVIDPALERFEVNFGSMQVTLSQREAKELQRPGIDVAGAAEAKGLPSEKLHSAQKAASYLEEHGLVNIFQDILHGLLLTKPDDPFSYIEERVARSRRMAEAKKERPPGVTRQASMGRSKIETLLDMIQRTTKDLSLVLPLLPSELRASLESEELITNCRDEFKTLDKRGQGRLDAQDLVPVLVELTSAKVGSIDGAQCQRFLAWFDTDKNGTLDEEEFVALVQFVIVAFFLESEDGRSTVEFAKLEEESFDSFIKMIEGDIDRLWSVVPFLPNWLVDHISSDEFRTSCEQNFKALDEDGSGTLEPDELFPVVESLCEAHPMTINREKCRKFAAMFDTAGNGVITNEEFTEFAQFLLVMNFLANSDEGKEIEQRAALASAADKTRRLLETLEEGPSALPKVMRELPSAIVTQIKSDDFKQACDDAFKKADGDSTGDLDAAELFPVLEQLMGVNPFSLTLEQYAQFLKVFDKNDDGFIAKTEFQDIAQYCTVMAYLHHCQENQDMMVAELLLGEARIQDLLSMLSDSVGKVYEVAPYLPQSLVDIIQSEGFAKQCLDDFALLDKDGSGSLEPNELTPVILQLMEAHNFALTQDHCRRFVEIFDDQRTGAISKDEYVNLARFMMIMAFLETDEGLRVQEDTAIAQAHEGVEELLAMLEGDRAAVHKVIPMLPKEVYADLTSDTFVMNCHERFRELDKDGAGSLRPEQLYGVVAELSAATPRAVTKDQCERFTSIFDVHGDGVLHKDEFLDFTRFLCVMSYLHSEGGKEACTEAIAILEDSKRVDELLDTMQADRSHIHKVIPYLPDAIRQDLLSEKFTVECNAQFRELDQDGNGTLDPKELYPIVLGLANVHELSLDMEQCQRFMAIFDDGHKGMISVDEFANFARFLIIMSFLASQEGQGMLGAAFVPSGSSSPKRGGAASPKKGITSPAHASPSSGVDPSYQEQNAKLSAENEALKMRMESLETLVRKMEGRLAEQELRSSTRQ